MSIRLILSDTNPSVLEAWKTQFARWPEVAIEPVDVLGARSDAFLLPGNSFGFLDGGLELRVLESIGWELEEELRGRIRREHDGELLVGQALVLRHGQRAIVYAPLWRTPRKLAGTIHPYLAVRGALIAIGKDPGSPPIGNLAIPALGVEGGGLDPRISARQIRYAYEVVNGLKGAGDKNLTQLLRREKKLQMVPGELEGNEAGAGPAGPPGTPVPG